MYFNQNYMSYLFKRSSNFSYDLWVFMCLSSLNLVFISALQIVQVMCSLLCSSRSAPFSNFVLHCLHVLWSFCMWSSRFLFDFKILLHSMQMKGLTMSPCFFSLWFSRYPSLEKPPPHSSQTCKFCSSKLMLTNQKNQTNPLATNYSWRRCDQILSTKIQIFHRRKG